MNRPLTPDEADALAAPEVQRQVAEINDYLTRGGRCFVVRKALGEAIADIYRSAGWNVEMSCGYLQTCILNLSRQVEMDPADAGAGLIGTDARST